MKKWISLLAVMALSTSAYSFSFDNFENEATSLAGDLTNKDNQTDLGASYNYYTDAADNYYQGSYWYAYNESDDGGSTFAEPDYIEDKEFTGGLEQGGNGGSAQCLHIKITHTGDVEYPFYGIGANLNAEGEYFDMSAMSAFSFYAKGEGNMKVVMKTKEANSDFSSDWGDYDGPFVLGSSWAKVTLSADDFEASQYSDLAKTGMGFSGGANKAVGKIHFQTMDAADGDVVDFYVDDIEVEGMTYENMASGGVSVADAKVVADAVELGDAYPNPFNPVTTINFSLPTTEKVSLKVFDAAGNLVKTLYNGVTAGSTVNWNATNTNGAKVASGVYFYRLASGSKVVTKKMVLLK